jgi:hypothetical protein
LERVTKTLFPITALGEAASYCSLPQQRGEDRELFSIPTMAERVQAVVLHNNIREAYQRVVCYTNSCASRILLFSETTLGNSSAGALFFKTTN